MHLSVSLWFHLTWSSLSILDICSHASHSIWELFSCFIYLFFSNFLSASFSSGTAKMHIFIYWWCPKGLLSSVCSSSNLFLCFSDFIFIALSSSSLMLLFCLLKSAFNPSNNFFISVILPSSSRFFFSFLFRFSLCCHFHFLHHFLVLLHISL